MRSHVKAKRLAFLAGALVLLTAAPPIGAQAPEHVRIAFSQWARNSLHPVSNADLDASTKDLAPIGKMVGEAKIVGLSEGVHGAAEPLIFRNRLFKHLVEHLGFGAIAIESGIVESRVLNDYVTQGKGEFDAVLKHGFSVGHEGDATQATASIGSRDSVCSGEQSAIRARSPARTAWRVILVAASARALEWVRGSTVRNGRRF